MRPNSSPRPCGLGPLAHLATVTPDNSPEVAFLRISVERAVVLRRFGFEGWEEWHPSVSPNLADPGNVEE